MNRNNDLLRRIVKNYFQVIAEKAGLSGLDEMGAELDQAFNETDERFAVLEARLEQLEAQLPIAK